MLTRAAIYTYGADELDAVNRWQSLLDIAEGRSWQLAGTYRDREPTRPELQASVMAGEVNVATLANATDLGRSCARDRRNPGLAV